MSDEVRPRSEHAPNDLEVAKGNGESELLEEAVEALEPASELPLGEEGIDHEPLEDARESVARSLSQLGYVHFDHGSADNTTASAMVPQELRKHFRRDAYVKIDDDEQGIEFLGRVVEGPFHAPHEIGADSALTRTTILYPERTTFKPNYYVFGSIEVLGQVVEGEHVVPTSTRPRPYSTISIFPEDRLQTLLGISGDVFLGHLMGYDRVEVRADIKSKNFLPRNVGVFGTVGSGKSNSTQVLIEEATQAGWAVVVVDVEGEYVRMDEPTTDARLAHLLQTQFGLQARGVPDLQVYVPHSGDSEAANPKEFKVPISKVEVEILVDLLGEASEAQLRMLRLITDRANRKAQKSQSSGPGGMEQMFGGTQGPRAYTLQDLIDGLSEDRDFPLVPGIRSTEKSTAGALQSKLRALATSRMLDSKETQQVPELAIEDLLVAGRLSVLDVSETDDRSRAIAISYLLSSLFERVLQEPVGEKRPPVLLVIEEVHTFVSRASASRMRAVIEQLQIISRRGRKRWMALALVSQQPGHVPDELFELVNTRFIHQLKSSHNLAPVQKTTGGVHDALWSTMPALGPGQCLLTGEIFRNPLFVDMRPAQSRRIFDS